jgi:iron(III) transport system ATP-binding protein
MSDRRAARIELAHVTKRYGPVTAVRDVSFIVAAGSLVTLLGPSGCGKTTTLRLIAGLETVTSGRILIGDDDVTALGATDRSVSMVFQSYALFPHMSVLDNVAYGPRVGGRSRRDAAESAREALAGVGLAELGERLPSELSGGQQQRVAIARALVLEPRVLLFDEPLSNLDARLRRQMREEIRALQQRLGITVVYVTHDQEEALGVSDRIIVMNHAVVAQEGPPRDLYETPDDVFVAGFMGEANRVKGVLRRLDDRTGRVNDRGAHPDATPSRASRRCGRRRHPTGGDPDRPRQHGDRSLARHREPGRLPRLADGILDRVGDRRAVRHEPGGRRAARTRLARRLDSGDPWHHPDSAMMEERVVQILDGLGVPYELMQIDPAFADTAACCEKYALPLESAGNTIVVASKKEPRKFGACVVKATRRLDVNHAVRALLGVSKVSFASAEETKTLTGMMIGGVTVFALPPDLPIYVDDKLMDREWVILGSGSRSSKIKISPEVFRRIPNTTIVPGLAQDIAR